MGKNRTVDCNFKQRAEIRGCSWHEMLYLRTASMRLILPSGCKYCVCVCCVCSEVWAASFVIQSSLQRLCNHVNRNKTIPLESLIDFTGMVGCHSECHSLTLQVPQSFTFRSLRFFLSLFFLCFQFRRGFIQVLTRLLVYYGTGGPGSINFVSVEHFNHTNYFSANSCVHLPTDSTSMASRTRKVEPTYDISM